MVRLSADVLAGLLDQAPDGVLVFSLTDHTVLDVNATFCEMSGWPQEDLIGRSVATLLEPEDLQAMPLAVAETRLGAVVVRERRLRKADGETLWCQTTTRRTDAGYLVFVRDVSELMTDRERLHQLAEVTRLRSELTAAVLAPEISVPALFERTVAGLTRVICDMSVIALVDRARGLLVPTAFHHREPNCREALRTTLTTRPTEVGKGLAGRVAADGAPARVSDLSIDGLRASVAPQYRAYVDRFPLNSMLIVPLRGSDGVIGTLGLGRSPAFTDEDEEIATDVASLLASAIEDARNDQRLQRANFLLHTVTNALPAMVSYWNADLRNEFANDAYRDWFGVTPDEIHQVHVEALLGTEAYEHYLPFIQGALEGQRQDYDRPIRNAAGRVRHIHVTYIPDVRPGGHVAGFVALANDVTPWTEAAAEFEHQALHDPLTGLRNRRSLLNHVGLALARLRHESGVVALFFLDLDDFKQVNDREGHSVGDLVLTATADRIRRLIRPEDTAARLGGDEFVVLCHLADRSQAEEIRDQMLAALAEPITVTDGGRLDISASIGLAVADNADATTPERLLAAADEAMFRRKRGESSGD